MKRRTILVSITLIAVIALSSVLQITQANSAKKDSSELLRYDFDVIFGQPIFLSVDDSGAPELIITETTATILDCKVTIDDQVYYYPDDFDIVVNQYTELNPITGEGLIRAEATMIFEIHGPRARWPSLSFWGVSRVTGWQALPDGSIISPENVRGEGQFELTGTKRLDDVTGFGIGTFSFVGADYTNMHVRQLGYIKGWSL